MSERVLKARSKLGVAARAKDPEAAIAARQELAAAKLEAYVTRTIAEAPPLTREQLDTIAAALHGAKAVPSA